MTMIADNRIAILDQYLAGLNPSKLQEIEVYIDMANIFVNVDYGFGTLANYKVFGPPHGGDIDRVAREIAQHIEAKGYKVSRLNFRPYHPVASEPPFARYCREMFGAAGSEEA
jgi:hypothetical protein